MAVEYRLHIVWEEDFSCTLGRVIGDTLFSAFSTYPFSWSWSQANPFVNLCTPRRTRIKDIYGKNTLRNMIRYAKFSNSLPGRRKSTTSHYTIYGSPLISVNVLSFKTPTKRNSPNDCSQGGRHVGLR